MPPFGKFVVFEGVDHCGKTTQLDLAEKWLTDRGHNVLRLREPGGTEVGERLRSVLLDKALSIAPRCEMLLFMASRVQLLEEKIVPALHEGRLVLLDRYWFSTYAYQGVAGGLGGGRVIEQVNLLNLRKPDLVILLDGDPEILAFRHKGAKDRIEEKGLKYQQSVRAAYKYLTSFMGGSICTVNAEGTLEDVHGMVVAALSKL